MTQTHAATDADARASCAVPRPEELGIGLLFWHMRDAVVVGEAAGGRVALWNPAAEALFGYAAEEAVGMPIEALVPAPLRPAHRAGFAGFAATGRGPLLEAGRPVEVPALRKGGEEIAVELSLTPIVRERPPGRYVLAIVRDATARVRLEREREALLVAAEAHARRLEELAALKADFAAMVAHELAGPVAAIDALAGLLAGDRLPAADRASALATIRTETDLLRRLVADVRRAADVERDDFAVRPRPTPVGVLLGDAAAYARALPGGHPLAVEIDVRPGTRVLADPDRIGQALRNLLGNAAKHTPPGTPIALRACPEGSRVRLEVADRGPGIRPDDLARVFEKFGRGRDAEGRRVHGAGLGLYLSRRIVGAHGSELTVATAVGEGATFGFALEAG